MPLEIGTASASSVVHDFFDSLVSLPSRLRLHGLPWTYSASHNTIFNDHTYGYSDGVEALRNLLYKAMHLYWILMSAFMLLFIYYCVFGFAVGIAGGELDTRDLEKMAETSRQSVLKGLDEMGKKLDQVAGIAVSGKNVVQEKIEDVREQVEEKLADDDRRKSWGGRKQEEAFEEEDKKGAEEKANWEAQEDGGTEEDHDDAVADDSNDDSSGRGGGIKDKVWRRRRSDAARTAT